MNIKRKKLIRNIPIEISSSILYHLPNKMVDILAQDSPKISQNYLYWKYRCYKYGLPFLRTVENFKNCIFENENTYEKLKNGRITIKEINTETKDITKMIIKENIIFISSDDSKIKMYENFKEKSLFGHKGGVWALDFDEVLVSGSVDKTIRIWDLKYGIAKRILNSHKSTVRSVATCGKYIVSGSRDSVMKLWLKNGKFLGHLKGHTESVRCITMNQKYILSGSYDGSVILWTYPTIRRKILQHHSSRVYTVLLGNLCAVSGSRDGSIHITNINNNSVHILNVHRSIVTSLNFSFKYQNKWKDEFLFSSGEDGILCKWSLDGKLLFKIKETNRIVQHIIKYNLLIIATEHAVRIYSLDTGTFIRDVITNLFTIYELGIINNQIIIGCKDDQSTKLMICKFE